jgi:hypothetical protein
MGRARARLGDTGVVEDRGNAAGEGAGHEVPGHEVPGSGPRASDAERDMFCAILQRHFADGRLSEEEFSQRLDTAMHARALGELYELVSDLPDLPVAIASTIRHSRGHKLRWWRR